jgi:hypothetical protein
VSGVWNFTIEQGADFSVTWEWLTGSPAIPVNLTGYTAHLQVRPAYAATAPGTVYLDLTSSSGITLGGSAGTIAVFIPASTTAALSFTNAAYDLKLTSVSGLVTRLLQGTVTLSWQVTV